MKNNKCTKCGMEIENESKYCKYCGNKLENLTTTNSIEEKEGDYYGLISLLLFYVPSIIARFCEAILPKIINNVLSFIFPLLPLAGVVIMIVGRVKYPKNTFLKVAMWLIIISAIISIIAIIVLILTCRAAIIDCSRATSSGSFG